MTKSCLSGVECRPVIKNALPLLSLVTHLYKGLTVDKNKQKILTKDSHLTYSTSSFNCPHYLLSVELHFEFASFFIIP